MWYRKIEIYMMTALLLCAALFFGIREPEKSVPFSFRAVTEGGSEEIHFWKQSENMYYVFLPSYIDFDELRIDTEFPVILDDITLENGMTCEGLALDKPYVLSYREGAKSKQATIEFKQSGNLPAMYIHTASTDMEYIHQEKGNEEPGNMRLYTAEGKLNYWGPLESIKMRGNNTDYAPKKPYSLRLTSGADLLGMGKAKKWILISNSFDPTHIRNQIVFDFAKKFGMPYTPDAQWIELFLNGEYAGLYMLCERNEIGPDRVDLAKSGSSLVSMEMEFRLKTANLPYILTKSGISIYLRYTEQNPDSMRQIFQSAENAINDPNGIDADTGMQLAELIDLDSWARKYLIEEVFGNIDGGQSSQYFYIDGADAAGKVYAGPVWDYDMAMANPIIFREVVPEMFYVDSPHEYFGSRWYYALCQKKSFHDQIVQLYREEFLPLVLDLLDGKIMEYFQQVSLAAEMDQIRWQTGIGLEETQKIQEYLEKRVDLFNRIWLENQEYFVVRAKTPDRNISYIVFPGEYLPILPEFESYSWYITGTDIQMDITQPIYEDYFIELRKDPTVQGVT